MTIKDSARKKLIKEAGLAAQLANVAWEEYEAHSKRVVEILKELDEGTDDVQA